MAVGLDETPSLRELEVLSTRRFNDVFLVDDVRLAGREGESEAGFETDMQGIAWYPTMHYDWRE